MRLHVKRQTRLGGFAYELRASPQDIYLNTEAGPTMPSQGMNTDKTGINRLHLVPNHGVLIVISREYLWQKKKLFQFTSEHWSCNLMWRQILGKYCRAWIIFCELMSSLQHQLPVSCTENSFHRFSLYLGPTWSQHPLHKTATWHRHTSRVTNVCCAGRSRVSTQPVCQAIPVAVSEYSLPPRWCIPYNWSLIVW